MEGEQVVIFDGYRNQNHLTVDLDERNKRMSQLEEDVTALADIFVALGEEVDKHQEHLDSIDDYVTNGQVHVHEGTRLIQQAEVHHRKSRKKKVIVIVIGGILFIIFIAIIIHYATK